MRRLVAQVIIGSLAVTAAAAMVGHLFREPLEAAAAGLVSALGLGGLAIGTLLTDGLGVPLPPDLFVFLAVAADAPVLPVLAVTSIASIAAGNLGYWLGPYIGRLPLLRGRLERFRPKGEALFARYGSWAVLIAALGPVPFSYVAWLAGIYRMRYGRFLLATLARAPRFVVFYGLFMLGWAPPPV